MTKESCCEIQPIQLHIIVSCFLNDNWTLEFKVSFPGGRTQHNWRRSPEFHFFISSSMSPSDSNSERVNFPYLPALSKPHIKISLPKMLSSNKPTSRKTKELEIKYVTQFIQSLPEPPTHAKLSLAFSEIFCPLSSSLSSSATTGT